MKHIPGEEMEETHKKIQEERRAHMNLRICAWKSILKGFKEVQAKENQRVK